MKAACAVTGLVSMMLSAGCGQAVLPAGPTDVAAGSLAARPADAQLVPFKGSFEGTQTVTPLQPPKASVEGQATGTGTQLGRFTVSFPHIIDFALAQGTGTYTFTAANGDTLTANFIGSAQVGPITSIVEEAEITGGTGRFAGASGTFTAWRLFDRSQGTTTGSFEGVLSMP